MVAIDAGMPKPSGTRFWIVRIESPPSRLSLGFPGSAPPVVLRSVDASRRFCQPRVFHANLAPAYVDVANDTIIPASLFRPTQDGIIKDETACFDLSAAAFIAKQLAK